MALCRRSTATRSSCTLAEKSGQFLPPNTPVTRAQMYSWLMFVATGIGLIAGSEALKDRFTFKTEMDGDANKQMFPQNARLAVS